MTTTDSPRTDARLDTTGSSPVPTPAARPRRQPRWIAAGVLASCLGGLGAALVYAEATGSQQVIQVTRPIARGEVIEVGDLKPVQVGNVPVSTVPADRLGELIGRRALIDLAGGAMLPDNSIGQPAVDRGFSQVGLRLAPGRLPVGDLPPGTSVLLIPVDDQRTGNQTSTSGAVAAVPIPATVISSARAGSDGVAMLLDVRVAQDRARQVAELAAADRVVLVREG